MLPKNKRKTLLGVALGIGGMLSLIASSSGRTGENCRAAGVFSIAWNSGHKEKKAGLRRRFREHLGLGQVDRAFSESTPTKVAKMKSGGTLIDVLLATTGKELANAFYVSAVSRVFLEPLFLVLLGFPLQALQLVRYGAEITMNVARFALARRASIHTMISIVCRRDERFADTVVWWLESPRIVGAIAREARVRVFSFRCRTAFIAGDPIRYTLSDQESAKRVAVAIFTVLNRRDGIAQSESFGRRVVHSGWRDAGDSRCSYWSGKMLCAFRVPIGVFRFCGAVSVVLEGFAGNETTELTDVSAKIGIDIRCPHRRKRTGVEEYVGAFGTYFSLWIAKTSMSSLECVKLPACPLDWDRRFPNVRLVSLKIPNKLLNFLSVVFSLSVSRPAYRRC